MSQWYLRVDGQINGPLTELRLKQLAESNRLPFGSEVANTPVGPWTKCDVKPPAEKVTGIEQRAKMIEQAESEAAQLMATSFVPFILAVVLAFAIGGFVFFLIARSGPNQEGYGMLGGVFTAAAIYWVVFHTARAVRRASGE